MKLLTKALAVAQEAHRDQKDKNGQPYIFHPIRVADSLKMYSEEIQAAGMLHDVLEDTDMDADDLKLMGFPDEVIYLVEILTREEDATYRNYIDNICYVPEAIIVKIADVMDNMPRPLRPLPDNCKGLEKRYAETLVKLTDRLLEKVGGQNAS